MATLNFGGFEFGNTVDAISSAGTFSFQSTYVRSGNYALRVNPAAATGNVQYIGLHANGKIQYFGRTTETFITFFMMVRSNPTANSGLVRFQDSAGGEIARLNLNTNGDVLLNAVTNSSVAGTCLANTWHRIDIRITTNATCYFSFDGGAEVSATGGNFTFDKIVFGPTSSNTMDVVFDDWVVDDTAFATDPAVKLGLPTAIATDDGWTTPAVADVDDVPHDSNTTITNSGTTGTNLALTFNMQSKSAMGVGGTIVSVKNTVVIREASSTTTLGAVRLVSGATTVTTTSVDIGNTTYITLSDLHDVDPNTSAAWTETNFNAIEVGAFKGADTSSIRITAVYVEILSDETGPKIYNRTLSLSASNTFTLRRVHPQILNFIGFETGNLSEALGTAGTGTISAQTGTVRSGTYALEINLSAQTGIYAIGGVNKTTGSFEYFPDFIDIHYATFYVRFGSFPAANSIFAAFATSSSIPVLSVWCDSSGNITIANLGGADVSGTIDTLSLNTWYRFELTGSAYGTKELSIDGGTPVSIAAGTAAGFQVLLLGTATSATMQVFYDDVVVSTKGFVTTPEVKISVPIGAGNYNSWTDGTGSTFAEVDEIPHDSATTYLQNTAGSSVAHTFDMQTASTIGLSGTIFAVKPMVIVAESASDTTTGGMRIRIGSTDFDTTTVDLGTGSYALISRIHEYNLTNDTAWDNTGFDAIEVGPLKGADTSSIRATAVYLMVLTNGYTPASFDRDISLSVSNTYSVAGPKASARSVTGSVANTIAFQRLQTLLRTFQTTNPNTYTPARTAVNNRTLTSSVSNSFSTAYNKIFPRSFVTSVAHAFSVARAATFNKTTTLSVSNSFSLARNVSVERGIASSVSNAIAFIRGATVARTTNTSVTNTVAFQKGLAINRSVSSSTSHTFSLARAKVSSLSFSLSVANAVSFFRGGVFSRTTSQTNSNTFSISQITAVVKSLTVANVAHAFSLARTSNVNRSFATSISHAFALARLIALGRSINNSIANTISFSQLKVAQRSVVVANTSSSFAIQRIVENIRSFYTTVTNTFFLEGVSGNMRDITLSNISNTFALARNLTNYRAIEETISNSIAFVAPKTTSKAISSSVANAVSFAKESVYNRLFATTIQNTFSVVKNVNYSKAISFVGSSLFSAAYNKVSRREIQTTNNHTVAFDRNTAKVKSIALTVASSFGVVRQVTNSRAIQFSQNSTVSFFKNMITGRSFTISISNTFVIEKLLAFRKSFEINISNTYSVATTKISNRATAFSSSNVVSFLSSSIMAGSFVTSIANTISFNRAYVAVKSIQVSATSTFTLTRIRAVPRTILVNISNTFEVAGSRIEFKLTKKGFLYIKRFSKYSVTMVQENSGLAIIKMKDKFNTLINRDQ